MSRGARSAEHAPRLPDKPTGARQLRVNTAKKRTHSLFTQGKFYYECIPNMSDARLKPLIKAYVKILRAHPSLSVLCQVPEK